MIDWARGRTTGFKVMALDGPLAALAAARDRGATAGIVRPRGDDGYHIPVRDVYRSIGFRDRLRTYEFRFA